MNNDTTTRGRGTRRMLAAGKSQPFGTGIIFFFTGAECCDCSATIAALNPVALAAISDLELRVDLRCPRCFRAHEDREAASEREQIG